MSDRAAIHALASWPGFHDAIQHAAGASERRSGKGVLRSGLRVLMPRCSNGVSTNSSHTPTGIGQVCMTASDESPTTRLSGRTRGGLSCFDGPLRYTLGSPLAASLRQARS